MSGIVLNNPTAQSNPFTVTGTVVGDPNTNAGAGLIGEAYSWNVINEGTIIGTPDNTSFSEGNGVILDRGVSVLNQSGALISGGGTGVYAWTTTNYGTITASGVAFNGQTPFGDGVYSYVIHNHGYISGRYVGALSNNFADRPTLSVVNYGDGTIVATGPTGQGVDLLVGEYKQHPGAFSGSMVNSGAIDAQGSAGVGVNLTLYAYYAASTVAGSVVNHGTISGNTGVQVVPGIDNHYDAAATIINYGTIEGTGSIGVGVFLPAGGSVSNNAATASISGTLTGVDVSGSVGTIVNLGTISASGSVGVGVRLTTGGTVTNGSSVVTTASIYGYRYGVVISGTPGTLINYNSITANRPAGQGLRLTAGTVFNAGTIIGELLSGGLDVVSSGG